MTQAVKKSMGKAAREWAEIKRNARNKAGFFASCKTPEFFNFHHAKGLMYITASKALVEAFIKQIGKPLLKQTNRDCVCAVWEKGCSISKSENNDGFSQIFTVHNSVAI